MLRPRSRVPMSPIAPVTALVVLAVALAAVVPLALPRAQAATAITYSRIASVPIGTTEAESVTLGDTVYLFGGFDVDKACCTPTNRAWAYHVGNNTWTALPPMPAHGIDHAGIATDGSRYVYYAGGYPADASWTTQLYGTTDGFRYDTVTGAYTALPPLPDARSAGGLAWIGGRLYFFGGSNAARTLDSSAVWMLDVAGGSTTWVPRAPMPNPRNHLGWAVIGADLYVVGGQHLQDSRLAQGELDRYDPATDRWTTLASLPVARSHLMDSTFVLDGRLVAAGGWTTSSVSAEVSAYDPASNSWQDWTSLPQARTSTTAKAVSETSFVFCCGSAGTSNADGWLGTVPTPPAPPVQPQPSPVTSTPRPAPAPTTAPTTAPTAAPTSRPAPAPTTSAAPVRPGRPAVSHVAVHPSTVRSRVVGKALVQFRLSRAAKVTLVLRRCSARRCTTLVARRTWTLKAGLHRVPLAHVDRRSTLPPAHYRVTVVPSTGRSVTLHLVVRR